MIILPKEFPDVQFEFHEFYCIESWGFFLPPVHLLCYIGFLSNKNNCVSFLLGSPVAVARKV